MNEELTSSRFAKVELQSQSFTLHYHDLGDGDRVVVMLHGSGPGASGWANFNRNISPLITQGFRVILLDCPGWGKSDSIVCSGSRSELNAEALNSLLEHLGIPQVSIIGNSMGGHSAVAFALSHPLKVERLILMGGGTGGASQFVPMPTEGIKLLQGLYRNPTIDNLKKMMGIFVFDPSSLTEELYEIRLENMLSRKDHLENFVKSLEINPKQFNDFGPRLHEIKAPTLVIWGKDDRFVPMDIGLKLIWGIPYSELHIFSRCGHWFRGSMQRGLISWYRIFWYENETALY